MFNKRIRRLACRSRRPAVVVVLAFLAACGGSGNGGGDDDGSGGGNNSNLRISGSVTSAVSDGAVAGVTVTLSGSASADATTDASGAYSFGGLSNGPYTVTASLTDTLLSPEEQSLSLSGASVSGVDFLALRGEILATDLEMLPESFLSSNQLRTSLVVVGNELLFTDSSDFPIKKQPLDGSAAMPLAGRFRGAGGVTAHRGDLYWIEGVRLMKTAQDGTTTVLAVGRGALGTAGLGGIVADDTHVYWVDTNPQSPCSPSCTWDVQRIPLTGGAPETLATADREIVSLTADATRLYWEESSSEPVEPGCNCGSKIRAVPKTGGGDVLLVDATLNGLSPPPPPGQIAGSWKPTGGLALTATEIVFAAARSLAYSLYAVPILGGSVRLIAEEPSDAGFARNAILDLRIADQDVYWIATAEAAVKSVPVAGGSVTELATDLTGPGALAVDEASAYWTESGDFVGCCHRAGAGSVRQLALAGGVVSTLAGNLDVPVSLAVDAEDVYWTEAWRLAQVPKVGGSAATRYSGIVSDLPRIAVAGSNIYVLDDFLVKVLPLAGGPIEKFAVAHFGAIDDLSQTSMDIATDATHAYWTVITVLGSPVVQRAAFGGGDPETVAAEAVTAYPQDCLWRIAVDGGSVYWSAGSVIHPVGCRVNRAPVGGGAVETIVDRALLTDFMVDGEDLYVSDFQGAGSVHRIPVSGGASTPVAESVFAWVLSDGGEDLFWLDLAEGAIGRISKAPGTPTTAASLLPVGLFLDPFLAFESLVADDNDLYCTESQTGSILRIF